MAYIIEREQTLWTSNFYPWTILHSSICMIHNLMNFCCIIKVLSIKLSQLFRTSFMKEAWCLQLPKALENMENLKDPLVWWLPSKEASTWEWIFLLIIFFQKFFWNTRNSFASIEFNDVRILHQIDGCLGFISSILLAGISFSRFASSFYIS